jgi:hypothetical protein
MKRILAALLFSVPFSALAVPSDNGPMIHPEAPKSEVTGTVSVLYPRCPGCPPVVRVNDGDSYTTIKGNLALDVAAFDGRVVTVKGGGTSSSFEANGFAPGKSLRFVTGTVSLESPDCPPNARCAQKVYLTVDGRKILVKDGFQFGLTGLEGATVTIRGDVIQYRGCAPGTRCIGSEPELHVEEARNLWVRGRIEKLAHGMNGQTHLLTLDNGETVLVAGKNWDDRNFATVWLNGKMSFERISGAPMFAASSASKGVPVVASIQPFPMLGGMGDGANVARDAGTAGGVAGSGAPTGGAEGAGVARQ